MNMSSQEHTTCTVLWTGFIHGLLNPEYSTVTIRLLHIPQMLKSTWLLFTKYIYLQKLLNVKVSDVLFRTVNFRVFSFRTNFAKTLLEQIYCMPTKHKY